ncbi:MAG: cytochrome P450 [Deltaproteobacteria bacterium]|nr:cytochrome P450 [Deltaproteobacteria bacterium]
MSDRFRRYGDIYRAVIYGANVYVSRDPQHAEHVLRENWQCYTKGLFSKRVAILLGNGLMSSEGTLWKNQRRMIQPAFHRNVVAGLTKVIASSNRSLLKKWKEAALQHIQVNVTRDISSMILEVTLAAIFGNDYQQVAEHFNVLSEEPTRDLKFAQAFRSLQKIVFLIAAERRKKNPESNDLLSKLMTARDLSGQPMRDPQLVNEIKTLIVAGHETTASTLNWVWYLLSRNPEAQDRLWEEVDERTPGDATDLDRLDEYPFAREVIEETMRLFPPGWLVTRKALSDDQLGEFFVPAGTEIYIPLYFIQRNPKLWEDPDRFDPDRFTPERSKNRHPFAMLPFSAGPRRCIGESLARVEMLMHVVTIAKGLRLRFVGRAPELDPAVNLRNKHDFLMEPEVRSEPAADLISECQACIDRPSAGHPSGD